MTIIDNIKRKLFSKPKFNSTAETAEMEIGNAKSYLASKSVHIEGSEKLFWKNAKGRLSINPTAQRSAHMVIAGSTGNGKSTLLRKIAMQAKNSGASVIMLDTEGEHESVAKLLDCGFIDVGKTGINIFSLDGSSIAMHISELSSTLSYALGLGYLQENLLASCMRYAYKKAGAYSLQQRNMKAYPTMKSLVEELHIFIRNSKSSSERSRLLSIANKISGIDTSAFNGTAGFGEMTKSGAVVSLSDIRGQTTRYIIMHELLSRLYSQMRSNGLSKSLRCLIMIDELDFIESDYSNASGIIKRIVREGRKYGIGLVVTTHMSSELPKDLIENSPYFISFCSQEPKERRYVASIFMYQNPKNSDFMERSVSSLEKYEFIIKAPEFQIPVMAQISRNDESIEQVDVQVQSESSEKNNVEPQTKVLRSNMSEEHMERVIAINEWLGTHGIKGYIINNAIGPDLVAYAFGNKIAVEYETGKKKAKETGDMLKRRSKEYDAVVVITNSDAYNFYKNSFDMGNILVLDYGCIHFPNLNDMKKA